MIAIVCRTALALLLATVLLDQPAFAQSPEEEFTRWMADRARAALPGEGLEITGPLELRRGREADGSTINVGRIYNFCQSSSAEDCESAAADFIARIVEIADVPEGLTREQLRIAVRHADFCDELDRTFTSADTPAPLHRPLAPQLCIVMMADFPTLMRSVTQDDLSALQLEPEAAWSLAERQTLANLPEPSELPQLGEAVIAVTAYEYVPSLLLNIEGWRRAEAAAGGELVVAVPSDEMLVILPRARREDIVGFRPATQEAFDTALRGISPLLYRLTEAGWTVVQ